MRPVIAVVPDVAAQRHAARRAPFAYAGRGQRDRRGAGGQHGPARAQFVRDAARQREPGADHLLIGIEQRRVEARRRQPARAGRMRGAAQDVVELVARQHRQRAGHIDPAAARTDAGDVAGALRARQHVVQHAEPCQGAVRIRNQPVAADLVARKVVLVNQHDFEARAREQLCAGAAGRTGADHQHVARRRGAGQGRHCERVGASGARWPRPPAVGASRPAPAGSPVRAPAPAARLRAVARSKVSSTRRRSTGARAVVLAMAL